MKSYPVRIIPRLDIKGPNLVKGIHLEGLRILGPPDVFARTYYEQGADELLFVDAVASLYGRNSLLPIIERTARNTFVPLTVGGGIRTVDDIRRILSVGADRVALNTAALGRPEFIAEAALQFGSSTIAIAIEAKRQAPGSWTAYTDNGRNNSGRDVVEWAVQATQLGAGEIIVTSVDNEGTGEGFDLDLTARIARAVRVPVVASGGAGSIDHIVDVILGAEVSGVGIASMLHYPIASRLLKEGHDLGSGGEFRIREERVTNSRVTGTDIPSIKRALQSRGIPTRELEGVA